MFFRCQQKFVKIEHLYSCAVVVIDAFVPCDPEPRPKNISCDNFSCDCNCNLARDNSQSNLYVYHVFVDNSTPRGTFSGCQKGGLRLRGVAVMPETAITAETAKTIKTDNSQSNLYVYHVFVDNSTPRGTFSGCQKGGLRLRGVAVMPETAITAETAKTVKTDNSQSNLYVYHVFVDNSTPPGTFSGCQKGGVEIKGGSRHARDRHNRRNRQNRQNCHGCLFVLHFLGQVTPKLPKPS